MKKNLEIVFAILLTAFIFIVNSSIKAAGDRIQVTSTNENGIIRFGNNGGSLSKKVVAYDNKKGTVTIELKFDNSEKTEIMFVVDNSTTMNNISNAKNNIVNALTTFTNDMYDNISNVKSGIMQVHTYGNTTTNPINNGLINDFVSTKSEMATAISGYSNTEAAEGNDFVSVMDTALNSFSETAEEKIIVLLLSGYNNDNFANYYTKLHKDNWDSAIKLYTVLINDSTTDALFQAENVTTKQTLKFITNGNLVTSFPTEFSAYLAAQLPTAKNNVIVTDYFTANILKGFNVVYGVNPNMGSVGNFDTNEKKFVWTIGNMKINDVASFRFDLELLGSDIPDTLINVPINSNSKVNVNFVSASGATTGTGDQECSPSVKILEEAIKNPKTGLVDIVFPTLIFGSISIFTYIYIKRKDKFVKI